MYCLGKGDLLRCEAKMCTYTLKCRYLFAMMKAHYKIEELSWTSNSTWTKSKVKWKFFKRVKGTYTYST